MIFLSRFFSLFALALAAIPFVGWLILICADFLSLEDCLSPQAGWTAFAFLSALSLVLPPALHAWPDLTRSPRHLLRETARAVLFAFTLFAVLFLLFGRPLFEWLSIPTIMLPMAALSLAPLVSCPLLYISYKVADLLLPRPGPDAPAPPAMRRFGLLSLLLVIALACHPFLQPGVSGPVMHAGGLSMLCAVWRFLALRYVIFSCGHAGFVPAWGGCCLVSLLDMLRALPGAGGMELAVMAVLFCLMLASSVCLLLPSSRRWLC